MHNIRQNPFRWAGTVFLMFLSVMLMGLVLASVDNWYDNWRDYSRRTSLTGPCAEAEYLYTLDPLDPAYIDESARDAVCGGNNFEAWMIVPWGLAVGMVASSLAISLPIIWRHQEYDA